jgi:hypothetical protein
MVSFDRGLELQIVAPMRLEDATVAVRAPPGMG